MAFYGSFPFYNHHKSASIIPFAAVWHKSWDCFTICFHSLWLEPVKISLFCLKLKGSSDQIHFFLEINVGKSRIRHTTTLNLNLLSRIWVNFPVRSRNSSFNFRVVLCRIRSLPILILNTKCLRSELLLTLVFITTVDPSNCERSLTKNIRSI